MAAQSQCSFVNTLYMSKKLEEIKANQILASIQNGDLERKKGRPLAQEKSLEQ